ncbi:tripartite tricarboxylate transporter substrate binding protein [Shumkonia mesophila]|uniref:tripartite tricarboxylate transporter substrate binding protein n=1 Tax=Shumkonia mesophila TaxID=2838854 RepID=UPI002935332D|nr:tripartite tricarboxylate transporter substrate binding protein [Shumkonia mesophila]
MTFGKTGGWVSGLLASVCLVLAVATPEARAAFPGKTINLAVWSGAGGALDIYGRKLAEMLTKEMGWTTKVENRPGGSGSVGMSYMMTQPADGHTWLIFTATLSTGIVRELIPFKTSDIRFVRAMTAEPTSLAVRKDSPLKSTADFVNYMKAHPKGLKTGGHSSGGFHQYMLFQLMEKGGFEAGWVPHDSSAKIPLNIMGGHIDASMMTPSSGLSQVQSGDIRLLGVSLPERSKFLPDVPTFKEQGFDLVDMIWRGVALKAGTPEPIVAEIQKALDKVEASAEWQAYMKDEFQENPGYRDDAFRQKVEKEIVEQRAYLEKAGFLKK